MQSNLSMARATRVSFFLAMALIWSFCGTAHGQSPQLISVGGYRLDVLRAGSGGPAVILSAASGTR